MVAFNAIVFILAQYAFFRAVVVKQRDALVRQKVARLVDLLDARAVRGCAAMADEDAPAAALRHRADIERMEKAIAAPLAALALALVVLFGWVDLKRFARANSLILLGYSTELILYYTYIESYPFVSTHGLVASAIG